MTQNKLPSDVKKELLFAQRTELTEHFIYLKLARLQKDQHNRAVFEKIAQEEFDHQKFLEKITGESVKPKSLFIWFYLLIARVFGITFGVKLMERGEQKAERTYQQLLPLLPDIEKIIDEEGEHERQLIGMLDEERLKYVSSMVLGLNDALVELIGALAGLTLALQKTGLVALAGLITGIAASMSMAASEYLSTKTEEAGKNPVIASFYTGVAYIFTVFFLIVPYFVFANPFVCLGISVANSLIIIVFFTYYVSVAKDLSFKQRFGEMALISLGIAAINFLVGLVIRNVFHIDV